MGRKSTKENKNIYQVSREAMEYSRETAAQKLGFISSDRIEKIENEKTLPHPEEILAMADCYKTPSLCNYFCSHECPIGIEYIPEIKSKELSQSQYHQLCWWFGFALPGRIAFPPEGGLTNHSFSIISHTITNRFFTFHAK